ncbi:Protein transport protein [Trichinella spiralis]|uniref:Protein transport protein n=1 Tax=Trichinella spiralis TaxID=6334 RepID=A0ABR3L320_TRISP
MRSLPACVICNDEFGPNLQSRRTTVASWSKQTVGRSVSFKERQILAALKLFVFGQACKVWPLSSLDTGAESTAATAKLKRSADGVKKKAWSVGNECGNVAGPYEAYQSQSQYLVWSFKPNLTSQRFRDFDQLSRF